MSNTSLHPYDIEDRQLKGVVKRLAHQMETRLVLDYYQDGDTKLDMQAHIKRARIAVQDFLDGTD